MSDTLHEIKHRFTGAVLFSGKFGSLRLCVEAAVEAKADLSRADLYGADLYGANLYGANLYGANLSGANLYGADLIDGGQRADGYRFVGWIKDGVLMLRAGCRNFTMEEARAHWSPDSYSNKVMGAESLLILDRIEATAKLRGMIGSTET